MRQKRYSRATAGVEGKREGVNLQLKCTCADWGAPLGWSTVYAWGRRHFDEMRTYALCLA